ncbi:MAG: DUF1015 domain-containing protein [Anaerolineaceae bacterium]|nr:DUF1015 domain-containing protein [Anaerolineaceae bacterium]
MRNYSKIGVQVADILLPMPEIDYQKWAVIACDQYTSEPEYWDNVKQIVGDAPSTFNLVLPEVYLGKPKENQQLQIIHQKMNEYLSKAIFREQTGLILVERTVEGKTRHGLVLALDLERYDYTAGSQSLIRATEGTIVDRLPPRIRIRENAVLELPHILVLIDDPGRTVIEPIISLKDGLTSLYDFDLMLGSGHLRGFLIDQIDLEEQTMNSLEKLSEPKSFRDKYGVGQEEEVLLFAMGDGNHSLATAKAIWEKIKSKVGMDHPARYALVEIENVHDEGLEFEPIHRVLFHVKENYSLALYNYFGDGVHLETVATEIEMAEKVDGQSGKEQLIGIISADSFSILQLDNPPSNLPAGSIQKFLDDWLSKGGAEEIDYVHGQDTTIKLGKQDGNLGFILPAMNKSDLFTTVILDGALPRKTFSMGEALEKRFYVESKRII